jgi:hypothetical protein
MSSVQSQSIQNSGLCPSEVTSSVDLQNTETLPEKTKAPHLSNLKKEIWSKKEKDEVLTVSNKRAKKMIQSNRKQSTPVGNIDFISGGFSWKKNRKQSENIVFNSMDGWSRPIGIQNNFEMGEFPNISKSTIFSLNLGMKKGQPHPKQKSIAQSEPMSSSYVQNSSVNEHSSKQNNESKNHIFSHQTNYATENFLENIKDINVSDHIKNVKSKSSINFIKKGENPIMNNSTEFKILKNKNEKKSSFFGLNNSIKLNSKTIEDKRKESDFIRITEGTTDLKPSQMPTFSLAEQNKQIQKKMELESSTQNKIETEDCLLSNLEIVKSQCESETSANLKNKNETLESRQDTPISVSKKDSLIASFQNLSEVQISSQINSRKGTTKSSLTYSQKSKNPKSNHLKMRLQRKMLLKKEKQKTKSTKNVTENLNNLIQKISRNETSSQNFSQLDINVMKTLSKSIQRSKLFLNTRSRYEFVEHGDTLRPCDIVVGPQDLPGSRDRDMLTITKLIKEFLEPSQSTVSLSRNPPQTSQQNKVNISF